MRVTAPPYDLLLLTACQDILALCSGLLERGERSGCLSAHRFYAQREDKGRHDAFWRELPLVLPPRLPATTKVLLLWDHQGSGREQRSCQEAEEEALRLLARQGVERERALAVALAPELEIVLAPVWPLVKEKLAQYRRRPPPSDADILQRARHLQRNPLPAGVDLSQALMTHPKELLEALRQLLQLGTLATVHQVLGEQLSLARLKGEVGDAAEAPQPRPVMRIAQQLSLWFKAPGACTL